MGKSAVTLRRAVAADAAAISVCVRVAYAKYVPRLGREPKPMTVEYGCSIAEHQVWVAEEPGRLVGALVLVRHTDHLLIENISVMPEAQGQGIGRQLLRLSDDEAMRQGLSEVRLYTNEHFTENIAFYAWYGYEETNRALLHGAVQVFMRRIL